MILQGISCFHISAEETVNNIPELIKKESIRNSWLSVVENFESGIPWDIQYKYNYRSNIIALASIAQLLETQTTGKQYLQIEISNIAQSGARIKPRTPITFNGFVRKLFFYIHCNNGGESLFADLISPAGENNRIPVLKCDSIGWRIVSISPEAGIQIPRKPGGKRGLVFSGLYVSSKSGEVRIAVDDIYAEVRPFEILLPQQNRFMDTLP